MFIIEQMIRSHSKADELANLYTGFLTNTITFHFHKESIIGKNTSLTRFTVENGKYTYTSFLLTKLDLNCDDIDIYLVYFEQKKLNNVTS